MIIDPANPEVAIDESDGDLMGAVHMLPINADVSAPTVADLNAAPIICYARSDAFTHFPEESA